ncbi:MAG: hypothetical protein QXT77_08595, partial [Candidatus Methanomethylicaceae archaeon]
MTETVDPKTGEVLEGVKEGKQIFVRCERTGDLFLTPEGREIVSSVPMAPPVGYKKQPSLVETIRMMVRQEKLAQELASQGFETFEEADDFYIEDDDFDDRHPYEAEFEPDASLLPPLAEQAAVAQDEASNPPADGRKASKS